MKQIYTTRQNINKAIDRIKNVELYEGETLTPLTLTSPLMPYRAIIDETKTQTRGRILSFDATNEKMRKLSYPEFTRQEYDEILEDLINNYGDKINVRSEKERAKQDLIDRIKAAQIDGLLGNIYDYSKMTYKTLDEVFRRANERKLEDIAKGYGSNNFWDYVVEEYSKYILAHEG